MDDKYGIELELITDAFEKKVKKIKKEAESIKEAFDPNDVSGMTITGLDRKRNKGNDSWEGKRRIESLNDGYITTATAQITEQNNALAKTNGELLSRLKYMHELKTTTDAASASIDRFNKSANDTVKIPVTVGVERLSDSFKKVVSSGAHKVLDKIKNAMHKISDASAKAKTNIQKTFNGNTFKLGLKNLLKYVTALFSIRSIYSVLSQSARAWLSSQNEGAQQLSANIEYLRYSLGSVFAPVIQFITDLVYQLMKAVQSLIYSFSGLNIFAKATASSMKSATASAKEASKALAGFDELTNLDNQNNGNGAGDIAPTYDLSKVEEDTNSWINDLKEKLIAVFEPIQKSWDTYGANVIRSTQDAFKGLADLGYRVANSFRMVWQDGTGQRTSDLILRTWISIFDTIGNVSRAFSRAWDNDGNGTKIIHNIWDGFNDIYEIIVSASEAFEKWTNSEDFQNFANAIVSICETLSEWFKIVTDKLKEIWDNGGEETFSKLLEFFGKVWEALDLVLKILTPIIQGLVDLLAPVIEWIIKEFGYVLDALSGILDFLIGIFTQDWDRAWQGIAGIVKGVGEFIAGIVSGAVNVVMWMFEVFVNGIIDGLNILIGGISDAASAFGELFGFGPVNFRLPHVSLPRLDTGTNYVPEDQLAYIHKGEAVIPKKFNSEEYFGGDEETKTLLEEIKEAINNIEINPYTTIKDVGKTAVSYINSRNRQLGGSVIN